MAIAITIQNQIQTGKRETNIKIKQHRSDSPLLRKSNQNQFEIGIWSVKPKYAINGNQVNQLNCAFSFKT